MTHDVFISYASADKAAADAVCAGLEASGVTCWMAPRDIGAGADFAEAIVGAIREADVLLLVLSRTANASVHIKRELDRAVAAGLAILPVRIEDVAPAGPFEYYLAGSQWFEAFDRPIEKQLDSLCAAVHDLLHSGRAAELTATPLVHHAQAPAAIASVSVDKEGPSRLSDGVPETRWARTTDGASIAYQYFGEGAITLVVILGWVSHLEVYWEQPLYERFMRRLARDLRVIVFDKRGIGMSDHVTGAPDLSVLLDDVRAVMDSAGVDKAAILAHGEPGPQLAAFFAASCPERTLCLLLDGEIHERWESEYPWGVRRADSEAELARLVQSWGSQRSARDFVIAGYGPDPRDAPIEDPEFLGWNAKLARYAASPTSYETFWRMWYETDVRDILPAIHVPTAVVCWAEDDERWTAIVDYLLTQITGAQRLPVPGYGVVVWLAEPDPYVAEVERFLASVAEEETDLDRVLATVLYTEVVSPGDGAERIDDRHWRELLDLKQSAVRALLARYRGSEVEAAGGASLATFDGPARAVKCAQSICDAVKPLGLEVRAGCHTGEIALAGQRASGIAIRIGTLVGALAAPSEVLVSSTVRDLVAGSGLSFADRGEHELEGVPGSWRLYAVEPATG